VGDVALGLRILAAPGQEHFDPTIPPVPWREPDGVDVAELRIAYYTDNDFFPASPSVRRAVVEAAEALRARGATVAEWTPPDVREAMRLFIGLLGADGGLWAKHQLGKDKPTRQIKGLLQLVSVPPRLRPTTAAVIERILGPRMAQTMRSLRPLSAEELWQMADARTKYRARFLDSLNARRFDAIVCPPYALP